MKICVICGTQTLILNNPKKTMKNPRKIDLIVVHCSATRVNQDFPVEALEACHKARGFRSIGYHYYITKDGIVYQIGRAHV